MEGRVREISRLYPPTNDMQDVTHVLVKLNIYGILRSVETNLAFCCNVFIDFFAFCSASCKKNNNNCNYRFTIPSRDTTKSQQGSLPLPSWGGWGGGGGGAPHINHRSKGGDKAYDQLRAVLV